MPLQIRRGNTAQRLTVTPLPGELIYDTTTGQIFVGDGATAGGIVTTGVTLEDARDQAASLFTNGVHTGLTFNYNDTSDSIDVSINSSIGLNNLTVNNNLSANGTANFSTETYSTIGFLSFTQHHGNSDARAVNNIRSRGTATSPTVVTAGDIIGKMNYLAYDGSNYVFSGQIRGRVDPDATVGTGAVAGKLEFLVADNAGVARTRIEIDAVKSLFNGQMWGVTNTPNSLNFQLLQNTSTVNDGARFMMRRSRGTYLAPTSLVNGDSIYRLGFGGHDGISYRDTAFITASVANTVSTNVIPTKLTVRTTNSVGALLPALEISEEQVIKVNTVGSLNTTAVAFSNPFVPASYLDTAARDLAIPTPSPGMLIYITSTGKFQGYNGITFTWNDLN